MDFVLRFKSEYKDPLCGGSKQSTSYFCCWELGEYGPEIRGVLWSAVDSSPHEGNLLCRLMMALQKKKEHTTCQLKNCISFKLVNS